MRVLEYLLILGLIFETIVSSSTLTTEERHYPSSIGIAVGVSVGIHLILVAIWALIFWFRKRKTAAKQRSEQKNAVNNGRMEKNKYVTYENKLHEEPSYENQAPVGQLYETLKH